MYNLTQRAKNVFKNLHLKYVQKVPLEGPITYSWTNGNIEASKSASIGKGCEVEKLEIDKRSILSKNSQISGRLSIGRDTFVGRDFRSVGFNKIGDFCAIGPEVSLQARNHNTNKPSMQQVFYKDLIGEENPSEENPIEIGNDVWIGNRAIILPGVEIGNGAIIGAGAVVTKDVQDFEIVGGVPAQNIGWRYEKEVRDKMKKIEWWNWSEDKIEKNKEFFRKDVKDINLDKFI